MSPDTAVHDGHALVAHHFENIEQQREVGALGMWVFLGSEILFFGALFTSYAMMRSLYPVGFALGSRELDPTLGGINTAVLLTSSLTMAMAVWAAHTAQRRLLHLFHTDLGRMIGPVLVSAGDPLSPTRLPPRVRETLQYLLEGDGEKQAAARMGLSRETVHQYVKALYRHYRVESRAELLARVLRRTKPVGEPPAAPPFRGQ